MPVPHHLAWLLATFLVTPLLANEPTPDTSDTAPLSFEFIRTPPGQLHFIGTHRLHADCRTTTHNASSDLVQNTEYLSGDTSKKTPAAIGGITIVFEAGLGGSSLEWQPVISQLPEGINVCTYDRTGYGWSDPFGTPRDARHLAYEADQLLQRIATTDKLILVGHSFGGFVVRLLAEKRHDIAALVLIDTSHEQQFERMQGQSTSAMLPSRSQFIIRSNDVPENLPPDIKNKVRAFSRMRKTYAATHGEMSRFRESAMQLEKARQRNPVPFDIPVVVIRRGKDLYSKDNKGAAKHAIWIELQEDLAKLSQLGSVVVAAESGHHVHVDEPALVASQLQQLIGELH